jgi:formate dehydrogenase
MAKVVCVLYDDPVDGYPKSYPRDDLPKIDRYPDGQTLPTPKSIDFTPGALLGSVSGELGLRKYLESNGHTLKVTPDKDGLDSVLERDRSRSRCPVNRSEGAARRQGQAPRHREWRRG